MAKKQDHVPDETSTKDREVRVHRMGGKEERASRVGKARADAEERERQGGGPPESEIPGPGARELLEGPKRGRRRLLKARSRARRSGPSELESEDKGV